MDVKRNHQKSTLFIILPPAPFGTFHTRLRVRTLGGSSREESLQLEQTRVALQQTQVALDNLAQDDGSANDSNDTPAETQIADQAP